MIAETIAEVLRAPPIGQTRDALETKYILTKIAFEASNRQGLVQLGQQLGCSHSTVLNRLRRYDDLYSTEPTFRKIADEANLLFVRSQENMVREKIIMQARLNTFGKIDLNSLSLRPGKDTQDVEVIITYKYKQT
jgi:hypothetical protein